MPENQHTEDVRITRSLERRYGVTHNQARASLHEFRRLDRALKSVEGLVPGVTKTQLAPPTITITETKTGSSERRANNGSGNEVAPLTQPALIDDEVVLSRNGTTVRGTAAFFTAPA